MKITTERVLDYFEQINAIPRCSGNEAGVAEWLQHWAKQHGFALQRDAAGNLVIRIPGTQGQETTPAIVLQGHMDMVCEKTPDSPHDFTRDPIRCIRDGDWLKADRTTLGADNGIAIAYALAIAESRTIPHPPLELLCTVNEETGLSGVMQMATDLINGKILINIDSEDEGIFTVGCSGGREARLSLESEMEPVGDDWIGYTVTVGGLKGGHSGIDIHKMRANANRLIARQLSAIAHAAPDMRLESLSGGSRHNAIARDARAVFAVPPAAQPALEKAAAHIAEVLLAENAVVESAIELKLTPQQRTGNPCFGQQATRHLLNLLLALPHGVQGMSADMPELVESSCNLAVTSAGQGRADIMISTRSSVASRMDEMLAQIRAIANLAGVRSQESQGYPPWVPQHDSRLLQLACSGYRALFKKDPVIQVIHAGLECAVIGGRYPGIEMISVGPTIRDPHSPGEKLYIPSVERVGQLLVHLLAAFCRT